MHEPTLSRAAIQSGISNAMVRIKSEFYGRGPARARTYLLDHYVFCTLQDVATPVEEALLEAGDGELVREVRIAFQDLMTETFTSEVEALVGRRVVGYHSQVIFSPPTAFEFFVHDPGEAEAMAPSAGEVTHARNDAPGEEGDADALPSGTAPLSTPAGRPAPAGAGPARSAISNAMTRLVRDAFGKGAGTTRTYLVDGYVFCALEDPFTTVEKTLVAGGRHDLVRTLRTRFHVQRAGTFEQAVEQVLERAVTDSQVQVVFDPDVLFYAFALADVQRPAGRAPGASDVDRGAEL